MSKPNGKIQTEDLSQVNEEAWAELDIDPRSLDPNFHHRIISDRPSRLARARQQGYVPALPEDVKSLSGNSLEAADGLIRMGDGIFARCPIAVFKEREEKQNKKKRALLSAPEGSFRKKARESSSGLSKEVKVVGEK